jgi:hypothetical protein
LRLPTFLPPSLCADVLFYLEYRRSPRDAYRVLSKYIGISVPKVIVDTKLVEERSMQGHGKASSVSGYYQRSTNTIFLREDFEAHTAIHEYFHHYSKVKETRYDNKKVREFADEVIHRGRLLLKARP